MKLTELLIQQALWLDLRSGHSVVMPNFTPKGWWECDMFAVTKSGYWSEHEIKLSVADFKADVKKEFVAYKKAKWNPATSSWDDAQARNKHQLLRTGDQRGPSRFWYVLAESIADQCAVPSWAGIKIARVSRGRVFTSIRRAAPLMHKQKCEKSVMDTAVSAAYWRYWSLKCDMTAEVVRQVAKTTHQEAVDSSDPARAPA